MKLKWAKVDPGLGYTGYITHVRITGIVTRDENEPEEGPVITHRILNTLRDMRDLIDHEIIQLKQRDKP